VDDFPGGGSHLISVPVRINEKKEEDRPMKKKSGYLGFGFVAVLAIGIILGIPRIGIAFGPPSPEPPPGVQDPNTLHLTGPAFIAKIRLVQTGPQNADITLEGRCANFKLDPNTITNVSLVVPWIELNKEFFENNGWSDLTQINEGCGWTTSHTGTQWIVLSPIAVPVFDTGEINGSNFIDVKVVYLGRYLLSNPNP
jgi:hypothetical protein